MCVFQHKRDVCLGFEEARAGGCKGRNLLTCFEFGFLARAFLKIDRALASLPICSFSSILRPRLGFFFFVRKRWRADDAIPLADTHLVPVLRARLSLPPSIASPSSSFFYFLTLVRHRPEAAQSLLELDIDRTHFTKSIRSPDN